jgi:hypothetical protein
LLFLRCPAVASAKREGGSDGAEAKSDGADIPGLAPQVSFAHAVNSFSHGPPLEPTANAQFWQSGLGGPPWQALAQGPPHIGHIQALAFS